MYLLNVLGLTPVQKKGNLKNVHEVHMKSNLHDQQLLAFRSVYLPFVGRLAGLVGALSWYFSPLSELVDRNTMTGKINFCDACGGYKKVNSAADQTAGTIAGMWCQCLP